MIAATIRPAEMSHHTTPRARVLLMQKHRHSPLCRFCCASFEASHCSVGCMMQSSKMSHRLYVEVNVPTKSYNRLVSKEGHYKKGHYKKDRQPPQNVHVPHNTVVLQSRR